MFFRSEDIAALWNAFIAVMFVLCALIAYEAGANTTKRNAVTLSTFEYKGTVYEVVKAIEE